MRTYVLLFLAIIATHAGISSAQQYPVRPVRMVVPFAPGGATDIIARALGKEMAESLGRPIVVDSRGGAGGVIGTDIAAKSAPDGYTLLMATAANAANASLVKDLPHDFERDLRAVSLVVMSPYMLVVHPSLPVTSVAQFIAHAKKHPGKLNYASAGAGSSQHLSAELFGEMAGVSLTHIPYKGTGAALADLLGGLVQLQFSAIPAALPHVRAGKLRSIAVTSEKRSTGLREVPTIAESGVPGYSMSGWFGIMAPRGTPEAIVATLSRSAAKGTAAPEINALFTKLGLEPVGSSSAEFSAFIAKEVEKYARIVRRIRM